MAAAPDQFVVLDVETTGLDPALGHEIIEIGAQKLRGRKVVGEFSRLLKPTRRMSDEVVAVHGITNEKIALEGEDPTKVIPEFIEFLGQDILVAQNAPFDIGFINAHLDRMGQSKLTNQVLDTKEIAKRYLILASYSLQNLAKYLKVPQPKAHRALVDVITTREVFFKLIERAQEKAS